MVLNLPFLTPVSVLESCAIVPEFMEKSIVKHFIKIIVTFQEVGTNSRYVSFVIIFCNM
jgi:hypothetical protein